jgi:uncharacterized phage protein (TIGR02220 family)
MAIFRVRKNANYVVMNRTALDDKRLSWKAKGILAYMLSMPDDWVFYTQELCNHAKCGKDGLRSGLQELKQAGYLKRYPVKENGKIVAWETIVLEVPETDFPQLEKPQLEFPQMANPPLLNTDSLLSTDVLSTEVKNIPFAEIVDYLNQKVGSSYRYTAKKTRDLIKARVNDGFGLDDFKRVIDNMAARWLNDPKMNQYLRPETLFGTKFESYLYAGTGGKRDGQASGARSNQRRDFSEYADLPY